MGKWLHVRGRVGCRLVTALFVSIAVAACSSASGDPSTERLTKPVSFNGVTLKVPSDFHLYPFNGCLLQAGEVIVGQLRERTGPCPYGPGAYSWPGPYPGSPTGVIFSTASAGVALESGLPWNRHLSIDGVAVDESISPPSTDDGQTVSYLFLRVPSHNVGITFEAGGAGSLVLADRIMKTIRIP